LTILSWLTRISLVLPCSVMQPDAAWNPWVIACSMPVRLHFIEVLEHSRQLGYDSSSVARVHAALERVDEALSHASPHPKKPHLRRRFKGNNTGSSLDPSTWCFRSLRQALISVELQAGALC
jgi:hypothetical protein